MADLLLGRVASALGDAYAIEAEIGRGGMGVVYRARDARLKRIVAIKVLPPELAYRDDVKSRFLREAQTAAQLSHPCIVPIYSVDERDGIVYFVMALVEGDSLAAQLAREARPPLGQVRRVLRDVADALAFAHARGIVHRDIKPDNILIDRASGRPMVTDFGIARAAEGDLRLTVTGIAVGTPAYMSPEQAMGEREIDGRSDLYSLAVVGYQMLAGELPYQASNTPSMLMKHISDTPRPLGTVRYDLPAPLVAAIERAMAKKPEERWSDAARFRDAIDSAGAPTAAVEPSTVPNVPHPSSAWKRPAVPARDRTAPAPPPRLPLPALPGMVAPGEAPVPSWMPPSWRDARRQWQQGEKRPVREDWRVAQEKHRRKHDSLETFGERPVEEKIVRFRRRLAANGATIGLLAGINLMTVPEFWWFLFPSAFMGFALAQRAAVLWADGVRFKDIFGRAARERLIGARKADGRALPSSAPAPSLDDMARRLAPDEVVAGPFGGAVRLAAGDRAAVLEAISKLGKADRELIPDVAPTVDALAERVGSLANALHRLDEDVTPRTIAQLEERIASVRAQGESRAREQTMALLERQQATLADLAQRRDTLLKQLESASLMLQSMRLDLIALRSVGVQSAMDDVTSATQEARALSREIGNVLDAARQIR